MQLWALICSWLDKFKTGSFALSALGKLEADIYICIYRLQTVVYTIRPAYVRSLNWELPSQGQHLRSITLLSGVFKERNFSAISNDQSSSKWTRFDRNSSAIPPEVPSSSHSGSERNQSVKYSANDTLRLITVWMGLARVFFFDTQEHDNLSRDFLSKFTYTFFISTTFFLAWYAWFGNFSWRVSFFIRVFHSGMVFSRGF